MRAAQVLLLALALAGCGGGADDEATPAGETTRVDATTPAAGNARCREVAAPEPKPDGGRKAPSALLDPDRSWALVVQTSCGSFTIELDQEQAPKASASLVALAQSGFFDGTTFHRVVPGFVIQGGDPTGTGAGGPGYTTVDVPPPGTAYTKGVVAMAKGGFEPPGSAGSQFFVVTSEDAGLPPDYAVVGKVTEGLETVLAIEALGVGDGPPSQPVVVEKVTVESS